MAGKRKKKEYIKTTIDQDETAWLVYHWKPDSRSDIVSVFVGTVHEMQSYTSWLVSLRDYDHGEIRSRGVTLVRPET